MPWGNKHKYLPKKNWYQSYGKRGGGSAPGRLYTKGKVVKLLSKATFLLCENDGRNSAQILMLL